MRRAFFRQDAVSLAPALLGCLLIHRTPEGVAGGMIVETEAYVGAVDKACHAYENRSARTEVMYQDAGYAYVYLIYGMHYCFNVVAGREGEASAVLVRALEPVLGLELMYKRRKTRGLRNLCSGPGKLCQALAISKDEYGMDVTSGASSLQIYPYRRFSAGQITAGPRINVEYAEECAAWPWRFYLTENPYVSK